MPRNFYVNALESVSVVGLGLRGVMGVQNMAATYGNTGTASTTDFLEGVVAMETGTIESVNNVATGQGTWQDYVGMAMMFAPVGQGKRDLESALRNEPDAPARDAEANRADEEGATQRTNNQEGETATQRDGEAYEAGRARIRQIRVEPFKRNPKHDAAEFQRQIEGQQDGLNNLTVEEFINNRDAYLENGRSSEGSRAQQRFREEFRENMIDEYMEGGKSYDEAVTLTDEYRDLTPSDTRKPKAYFVKELQYMLDRKEGNFKKYRRYVNENNATAIKNISYGMSQCIYYYVYAWYNLGKPITEEWVDFYKEYFEFYINSRHKESVLDDSLKILGIGILLGAETSYFKQASEKLVAVDYRDYVLDTLIASQYPEHPVSKTVLYPDDVMIRHLVKVIDTADKDAAQHLIKDHLDNAYYTKAVLEDEYNSHKRDDGLYNGYWSIDSAVLVKIKGLDDSSFKDNPYYPQDLVHWQNT